MTTAFQETAFQVDAFQIDVSVVVQELPQGRGSWDKLRGKKRKPKVIRFSDFDSREAIAEALKASIAPKTIFIEPTSPLGEIDDDDTILLVAVSRLIH